MERTLYVAPSFACALPNDVSDGATFVSWRLLTQLFLIDGKVFTKEPLGNLKLIAEPTCDLA